MTTSALTANPTKLKRSLGLWAIVGLGLGYMTPMTVFDTFGYVSEESGGLSVAFRGELTKVESARKLASTIDQILIAQGAVG